MRGALPSLFVVCLVSAVVVGIGVSTAASGPAAHTIDGIDVDRPVLIYDVTLTGSGDAHWNISVRFPIDTTEREQAFEQLVQDLEADGADEYLPIRPYELVAAELADTLGRSMSIEDVEREISTTEDVGIVSMTFTWRGFAEASENRVQVGDVFVATEYTWLSTLEEDEYLRIHSPPNYTVESSGMPVHNTTMWTAGPADLDQAELSGTFVRSTTVNTSQNGLPIPGVVGGLVVVGLVLVFMLLSSFHLDSSAVSGLLSGETREGEVDDEESEPPSDTAEPSEPPLVDRELLSDEELVLTLIESNGGRMKQAQIVTETDWSNAKVSQLLSEMADEGTVEKLRIGRENLITLPEDGED